MLNLTQLNHLVALADECHFARAADRVCLSQPAFSRSIQAIERSVDMRLFERQSRDVRPTPAGLFLIERARRLLSDARNVERDVDLYRDAQLGDTAFGVGPFPAATMVPQVLAAMRLAHPEVAIRVEVDNWKQLLDALLREEIEFFVADTRDVGGGPELEILPLDRQRGVFCVRAGHPLVGQQPSFAQLWSYGVAATKLPQAIKLALGSQLGLPRGELPRFVLECDDVRLLHTIATTTDTVVATTLNAVQGDTAGALVAVQVNGMPALYAEMGVVRLRNRTPSPMSEKVVAAIFALSALG